MSVKLISKCFCMAPHIRSYRLPCSCFLKKVSLQLSSEQSIGDVRITQLDWKRVPQARSRGCKSSVAVTIECSRHHASRNVSWPQRVPSAVRHKTAVIGQVERRLPGQRLWFLNSNLSVTCMNFQILINLLFHCQNKKQGASDFQEWFSVCCLELITAHGQLVMLL